MNTVAGFLKGVAAMKPPWVVWVALLAAVNGVAPWFFIETVEAQVVVAAILVGAVIQLAIFRRLGFVRLLGLGHVLWLAMLPWLAVRLSEAPEHGALQTWIATVIVIDGISLVIDIVDVVRFARGERAPIV